MSSAQNWLKTAISSWRFTVVSIQSRFDTSRLDKSLFSLGLLGLKNEEYSPKNHPQTIYSLLEFVSKRLLSKRLCVETTEDPAWHSSFNIEFFSLFKSQLPELSVTLPMVIFGILSLSAGLMILRLPETLNSNMSQTMEEANLAKEYYGFMWMGKRVGNPFPCLRWDIARNTLKQVKLYWGVKGSILQLTY